MFLSIDVLFCSPEDDMRSIPTITYLNRSNLAAIQVDLLADDECFKQLKACGAVCMASSEETSEEVFCSGR
jgi:hypothetical protein